MIYIRWDFWDVPETTEEQRRAAAFVYKMCVAPLSLVFTGTLKDEVLNEVLDTYHTCPLGSSLFLKKQFYYKSL